MQALASQKIGYTEQLDKHIDCWHINQMSSKEWGQVIAWDKLSKAETFLQTEQ